MQWACLVTVHATIPQGVFVRILHEYPEFCSAKRRSLPFLCIAERVNGHGVNSNPV